MVGGRCAEDLRRRRRLGGRTPAPAESLAWFYRQLASMQRSAIGEFLF